MYNVRGWNYISKVLRIAQIPIDGLESPASHLSWDSWRIVPWISTNRKCVITPVIVIPWVQGLSGELTSVANLRENVWWSRKYKPSWSFCKKKSHESYRISWIPLNPTIFPGSYPSSVATGTISPNRPFQERCAPSDGEGGRTAARHGARITAATAGRAGTAGG